MTSAAAGYLLPAPVPAPLEGDALGDLLQAWVVGLTGLAGPLVRPRWQPEPPVMPPAATSWAAVGVVSRPADTFPYLAGAALQRHEVLNVLISFYDTGVGGLADYYAALFRDGAAVPQNLAALLVGGVAMRGVGDLTAVPSQFKTRWLYRVDLPVELARQVDRTYPVLDLLSAQGSLVTDDGQARDINI